MRVVYVAKPGDVGAERAAALYTGYCEMTSYETYIYGYHNTDRIAIAGSFVLALVMAEVLAIAEGLVIVAFLVPLVIALLIRYMMRAVVSAEPNPVHYYKKYVKRGTALTVPQIVMDSLRHHASQWEGLEQWPEYPGHRYRLLQTVMAEVGDEVQVLVDECPCGFPATCPSATHEAAANRQGIQANVDAVVAAALLPVVQAFQASSDQS